MKKLKYVLSASGLLLAACSKSIYAPTNKIYKQQAKSFAQTVGQYPPATPGQDSLDLAKDFVGTINFNLRKPNFVIIHYTAQDSVAQTLKTFTLTRTQVSAHYVVAKDGKIYHMLNDYMRAWHAGVGKWANDADINSSSIGIEIDNNGTEPFTTPQIASLTKLLGNLKKNYNIPAANFIGHADIAPKRKPDPGVLFPWKDLARKGFGLWYDDILELPPVTFDYRKALHTIGYDVSDYNAAIVAFKKHFIQTDVRPHLTQLDMNVIYNLYQKY
ncbi:N-acetylmuramoyl-L-alanine amidase [Pedobacter sp. HMF7647]|uniref:N-acetylmuramoyl-L-alanine amidase n=1 Tax=Hufsiella arboris TaxID=2695275 RepID=A0A7K1Y698_9SPHI|nr:N-acetylmuramoyl-L-alanine amidase [Hufsiella arboris]MXV49639.1 N-acetylmuramoyl-L-alanine amidase [Hufsiella arboris]